MLDWRDFRLCKGGSKSGGGGGGGGSATASNEESQRSEPKLPNGVEVFGDSSFRDYSFEVAGIEVNFTSSTMFNGTRNIGFLTDGEYDRGTFSGSNANKVAVKIAKIMKYEAATAPEGTKFMTNAYRSDGFGASRSLAYQKVGFTRPVGGKAGGAQYAVVKNGKLVPDRARVKADERAFGMTAKQTLAAMRNLKKARQEEKRNGLSL